MSMKKLKCFLVFAILVNAVNLKAQNINSDGFLRLDSFFVAANQNQWVAGNTVLVVKDGKKVFDKTYGFRDREANILLKSTDIFRLASMTKPIVTVAAMILIERGKLKLDDELSKFIPEFKHVQVLKSYDAKSNTWISEPAAQPVTIRHLMSHTSGIGSGLEDKVLGTLYVKNGFSALMFADSVLLGDAMKKLANLPLAIQPGSKFNYGISTDVLGAVIEIAGGMPLDQFVSKNILVPLKMNDTYFFQPVPSKDRLAVLYGEFQSGKLTRIPQGFQGYQINYPISGPKKYLSGAGGMSGTINDYAQFLLMVLNKGTLNGTRILNPETIALMSKNQIGEVSLANGNKFGLGFEIESRQVPPRKASVGKLSWGGAFNTTFWIDPKRNSIAILMSQVYPAIHQRDFYTGFEKLVNEALDQKR